MHRKCNILSVFVRRVVLQNSVAMSQQGKLQNISNQNSRLEAPAHSGIDKFVIVMLCFYQAWYERGICKWC